MPNIGDALKKAVELKTREEAHDSSKERAASPLMNANRRRIFQFLCLNPCSHIDAISSSVNLSRSSVIWHIECLAEAGYVQSYPDGRSRVFFPKGLVSSDDVPVFIVLGIKECRNMYTLVLQTPGTDTVSLLGETGLPVGRNNFCIRNLLKSGLITQVMDGRHARYFPTERYRDFLKSGQGAHKGFIRFLLRKLADEHLRPEIYDFKGADTVIDIQIIGQKEKITVPQRKNIELTSVK